MAIVVFLVALALFFRIATASWSLFDILDAVIGGWTAVRFLVWLAALFVAIGAPGVWICSKLSGR